jgi:putative transposase
MSFTRRLDELGLFPSYGSTGDCFDCAAMETFGATLKLEIACIRGSIRFADEGRAVLFEHIEVFYP